MQNPLLSVSVNEGVLRLVESLERVLRDGEAYSVRLAPLVLRRSLAEVIRRRKRMFNVWRQTTTEYGLDVMFERQLRRSPAHPDGRIVSGEFSLAAITDNVVVVVSTLDSDSHLHGPKQLLRRTYPLATRPFLTSFDIVDIVQAAADRENLDALCTAIGYSRETQEFRRECKRQSVGAAALEMAQQQRDLHRANIRFTDAEGVEQLTCSFDRYGAVAVRRGSVKLAVEQLVLQTADIFCSRSDIFNIGIAATSHEQESVLLLYPEGALAETSELEALCESVRTGDGLGVSVIHLNPYLHAQILDYFSGATVDMSVVDGQSLALVPRTPNAGAAMERIAATILRFFGEASPRVAQLHELEGGNVPV